MGVKGHQNKFIRIITLPFRFLKKGKDMYVKSMMDVASKPRYGSSHNMMGSRNQSSKASSALPKSFSTSFAPSATTFEGDDLRELIRANSTAYSSTNDPTNKLRMDMDLYLKQLVKEQQVQKLKESLVMGKNNNNFSSSQGVVPRSVSVGMGKIDEEKPFEEDEEEEEEGSTNIYVKKKSDQVMFPRSRSHAVTQTSAAVF